MTSAKTAPNPPFSYSYPCQEWLSESCKVTQDSLSGRGVAAVRPILRGTVVAVLGGSIVTRTDLEMIPKDIAHLNMQVEEDLYILTLDKESPASCINHSCEPNVGLEGQIALIAMRDIRGGEEITFDYAMCDGSPYIEFPCSCGSKLCRGNVTGNDWKLAELQDRYRGYFSPYLTRRINKSSHY